MARAQVQCRKSRVVLVGACRPQSSRHYTAGKTSNVVLGLDAPLQGNYLWEDQLYNFSFSIPKFCLLQCKLGTVANGAVREEEFMEWALFLSTG